MASQWPLSDLHAQTPRKIQHSPRGSTCYDKECCRQRPRSGPHPMPRTNYHCEARSSSKLGFGGHGAGVTLPLPRASLYQLGFFSFFQPPLPFRLTAYTYTHMDTAMAPSHPAPEYIHTHAHAPPPSHAPPGGSPRPLPLSPRPEAVETALQPWLEPAAACAGSRLTADSPTAGRRAHKWERPGCEAGGGI